MILLKQLGFELSVKRLGGLDYVPRRADGNQEDRRLSVYL